MPGHGALIARIFAILSGGTFLIDSKNSSRHFFRSASVLTGAALLGFGTFVCWSIPSMSITRRDFQRKPRGCRCPAMLRNSSGTHRQGWWAISQPRNDLRGLSRL